MKNLGSKFSRERSKVGAGVKSSASGCCCGGGVDVEDNDSSSKNSGK
jgi:hypothetical protein